MRHSKARPNEDSSGRDKVGEILSIWKAPIYMLYVTNWIIYKPQNPHKAWQNKLLFIISIITQVVGILTTSLVTLENVNFTPNTPVFIYIFNIAKIFPALFGCVVTWKLSCKDQLRNFVHHVFNSSNNVLESLTKINKFFLLLNYVSALISFVTSIFFVAFIFNEKETLNSVFSVIRILSILCLIHQYILIYTFPLLILLLCLCIFIKVKHLKHLLAQRIAGGDIYREGEFSEFTTKFNRIVKLVAEFKSIIPTSMGFYLVITTSQFISYLYVIIYLDKCEIFYPDNLLLVYQCWIVFNVVLFLMLVLPAAYLYSQVCTPLFVNTLYPDHFDVYSFHHESRILWSIF